MEYGINYYGLRICYRMLAVCFSLEISAGINAPINVKGLGGGGKPRGI